MNLTSTTIRKLQALNLDQPTFNAVIEIFEEAGARKPKKGDAADRSARGMRLPNDWVLPKSWGEKAVAMGMRDFEVRREAEKFKNYWCGLAGPRSVKLDWPKTFTNWCISMLERAGRPVIVAGDEPKSNDATAPSQFSPATWAAIASQFRRTGAWNAAWGPEPGSKNCLMPPAISPQIKVDKSPQASML